MTILTGLEIDSVKSGIKPELLEYLGNRTAVKSLFLKYKRIAGDPDEHKWHETSKVKRLKAFFADIEFGLSCKTQRCTKRKRQGTDKVNASPALNIFVLGVTIHGNYAIVSI